MGGGGDMGGGMGGGSTGYITFTYWDGMPPPDLVRIDTGAGGIYIQFNTGATYGMAMDALQAWWEANKHDSMGTMNINIMGDDIRDTEIDRYQMPMYLSGNGQSSQFLLKAVDPTGAVKQTSFY